MEIKLFGKELFSVGNGKAKIEYSINEAVPKALAESKFLPDFEKMNGNNAPSVLWEYVQPVATMSSAVTKIVKSKKKTKKEIPVERLTPKGIYELKALNDTSFVLNTDVAYIDQQITNFKEKLELLKSEEYDMRRGTTEIASIVVRLENRKKYESHKEFYEQYPYTTKSKIDEVISKHNHLKVGEVAQFMADMPKEAVDAMKNYNKETDKLCGKQAVFYIIADKKDFEKTNKRRDPILVAQSPFGHIYQIIGAWDEEMIFLEEL